MSAVTDTVPPGRVRRLDRRAQRDPSRDPGRIRRLLATRRKRELFGPDGKLMIIACDHPARGALGAAASRWPWPAAPSCSTGWSPRCPGPGWTVCWPPPTSLEDLLLLGALGGQGGLRLDEPRRPAGVGLRDGRPAHRLRRARACSRAGFDGGKMLVRIDLDDPGTVATLEQCGAGRQRAQPGRADRHGRAVHVAAGWTARSSTTCPPDAVIKSVHIAQGLGASSAYTWLKLPVVQRWSG